MQIGIECNIKYFKHEASHLNVAQINEHFIHVIQWNSFGVVETLDDGRLRPKHVVRRGTSGNSCIVD
jgi:hypothetical protein